MIIVALGWICFSAMISALIQAWTITKLWTWFVAAEYGPGPSMGAWYGISIILGLIVGMAILKIDSKDEPWDVVIKTSVNSSIIKWGSCLLLLAICWAVGSFLGWKH